MAISLFTLTKVSGVLKYPNEAANYISNTSVNNPNTLITKAVLSTRAGTLRFPKEAAKYTKAIYDD